MKYFYTIYTRIRDGIQEYTITEKLSEAIGARAAGQSVFVGFSSVFPGSRRF